MKKIILLSSTILILISCSSTNIEKHGSPVGIKLSSDFDKNSNLYKNGYEYYNFIKIDKFQNKAPYDLTELRFQNVFSSSYIQLHLFNKFGEWNYSSKIDGRQFLIWQSIKIFNDSTETFTVVASGSESEKGLFTSVIVFDSDMKDCLSDESEHKDGLVELFSEAIKNVELNPTYFRSYRERVVNFDKDSRFIFIYH